MKNYPGILIGLIILCYSCFLITCSSRKAEPLKQKAFVARNESIANGEKVFMMHCQKCHPGGEAGIGPALNSNPAPPFIKRFQVRHGLGVMPSFKEEEISKNDVKDISKYLKAWKRY
jgi:mono/diheme cytochrome c family protein